MRRKRLKANGLSRAPQKEFVELDHEDDAKRLYPASNGRPVSVAEIVGRRVPCRVLDLPDRNQMIIDLRTEGPSELSTGIAIVGGGPAGMTVALRLLERGIEAVLLEAGGERISRVAQSFYHAALVDPEAHQQAHLTRTRVLGGTTAIWGGRCIPFDPIDFERRPWIPHSGWPIEYAEAARYLQSATALCEAGRPDFETDERFLDACGGEDAVLNRVARYSQPTHFGKRYRRNLAASGKIRVLLNANATEILVDEVDGRAVKGVRVRTVTGRDVVVHAKRVVVAAGGLEAPRLLLTSNKVQKRGLGNERDLVGRFYQSHIEGPAGAIRLRSRCDAAQLLPRLSRDGVYTSRYIALSSQAQRRERLAGFLLRPARVDVVDPDHRSSWMSASFLARSVLQSSHKVPFNVLERRSLQQWSGRKKELYGRHLVNVAAGMPTIAANTLRKALRPLTGQRRKPRWDLPVPLTCDLEFNAEQIPNPESRVHLTDDLDALGMPRLAIRWSTTSQDRDMTARAVRSVSEALAVCEGAEVIGNDEIAMSPAEGHHIGTTRMAATPAEGVVDRNCAVFGVHGLYVAGSSVFPTSGAANPTLMIVVLALRLADHLS